MRLLRSPAFWVSLVTIIIATLANIGDRSHFLSSHSLQAEDRPSLAKMASDSPLMREGALLSDAKGRFRKQGERYLFVEEGSNRTYKCLENICLQRVVAAMQDEDRKLVWTISAKATEFSEENFLILDKAVRSR